MWEDVSTSKGAEIVSRGIMGFFKYLITPSMEFLVINIGSKLLCKSH